MSITDIALANLSEPICFLLTFMLNFYIIGDIGNTDIKFCLYKNKKIIKKIRLSTNKVNLKYLKKNLNVLRKYDKKLKQILFCSVVPICYKKIKNYF